MAIPPLLDPDNPPTGETPARRQVITAFAVIIDVDGNAEAIGPDAALAAADGVTLAQALAVGLANLDLRRVPTLADIRRGGTEVADLCYAQMIDNVVLNGARARAGQAQMAAQLAAIQGAPDLRLR